MRFDIFMQLITLVSIMMGGIIYAAKILWETARLLGNIQYTQQTHEERLDDHEERLRSGGL